MRRRASSTFRYAALNLLSVSLVLGIASCAARPGDAPVIEEAQPTRAQPAPTPSTNPRDLRTLRIGVGQMSTNLNPHVAGNVNVAARLVAELTLPSAFIEGEDPQLPGGTIALVPNTDVFSSIEPNDPDVPTAVTYTFNSAAQWSDGTPMSPQDLQYLAEQIATHPVSSGAALYARISSIETLGARQVRVNFDQPFGEWKSLFRFILPSHIYGNEKRNFASMMQQGVAASGGQYRVASFDSGRGLLELERNDRWWGSTVAATDRLVFTTAPDAITAAQMLRTSQLDLAIQTQLDTTQLTWEQMQGLQIRSATLPLQLQIEANAQLLDVSARRQLLSLIDPTIVGQVATASLTYPPVHWNPGFARIDDVDGNALSSNIGSPVRIGAAMEDAMSVRVARTVADQLTRNGVYAEVVQASLSDLELARGATSTGIANAPAVNTSPGDTEPFATSSPQASGTATATTSAATSSATSSAAINTTERSNDATAPGDSTVISPVHLIVRWNEVPNAVRNAAVYLEQFGCIEQMSNQDIAGAQDSTTTAEAEPLSSSDVAEPSAPSETTSGAASSEDQPTQQRNSLIGNICDPTINALLADESMDEATLAEAMDRNIADLALVMPVIGTQHSAALSTRILGPSEDFLDWPVGTLAGLMLTAPSWRNARAVQAEQPQLTD